MLEVTFFERNHRYSIAAKGHAEYGPYGQNIVCAAVSVLLQSYGNYLENLDRYNKVKVLEIKYEDGDIKVEALDTTDRIKDLFLMTMGGIEDVYNAYPGLIHLNYKTH